MSYAQTLSSCRREEEALAHAHIAIQLDPHDPVVLARAASLLLDLDQLDAAREASDRAHRLASEDFPFAAILADIRGKVAWREGRHSVAEAAFRMAFEAGPSESGYADYARHLGMLLADAGQIDEARKVVAQALASVGDSDELRQLDEELAKTERDALAAGPPWHADGARSSPTHKRPADPAGD